MDNEKENKENMGETKAKRTVKRKVAAKSKVEDDIQVSIQKFDDLEGKFLLVKVGTDNRPASGEDIEDIETKLIGLLEENNVNCLAFVTHHAVEFEIIEKFK